MYEEAATPLYQAYAQWCEQGGEFKQTQTKFGGLLEDRGITAIKRGGKKFRVGIRVRNTQTISGTTVQTVLPTP